jgi:hypothetical protein
MIGQTATKSPPGAKPALAVRGVFLPRSASFALNLSDQ